MDLGILFIDMGQVLYRKYRSKTFDDVVGQSHVTDTLKKALAKGKQAHAYLLTGPRGVGKTSIARILAFEINKIEYDESQHYIDIIEIDAASNRRIDEIRELRDKINLVPAQLTYKVYIIDEVHMLTREAFNALLKTLEEPPEHAIFILATTELHKVPETIISRCQRYTFKNVPAKDMMDHLKSIAKQEDIKIDEASLQIIAEHSNGSFRDALSLLDQLGSLNSKVTESETRSILGLSSEEIVDELINHRAHRDIVALAASYREAIDSGSDPLMLASQVATKLRNELHNSQQPEFDIKTLKALLTLHTSRFPEALLEIILMDQMSANSTTSPAPTPIEPTPKPPTSSPKKTETADKPAPPVAAKQQETPTKPAPKTSQPSTASSNSGARVVEQTDWNPILDKIKSKRNTLYGILRMAKSEITSGDITLHFAFPFHVKRASDTNNQAVLESSLKELDLRYNSINIEHTPDVLASVAKVDEEAEPKPAAADIPGSVLDVFSGAEIMET